MRAGFGNVAPVTVIGGPWIAVGSRSNRCTATVCPAASSARRACVPRVPSRTGEAASRAARPIVAAAPGPTVAVTTSESRGAAAARPSSSDEALASFAATARAPGPPPGTPDTTPLPFWRRSSSASSALYVVVEIHLRPP